MGVVGDCKNEGEREWSRQRKRKKRDVGMGLPSQVKVEGSARIMNESGRGNVSGDLFSLSSSLRFVPHHLILSFAPRSLLNIHTLS
jgi:hypothetical protein